MGLDLTLFYQAPMFKGVDWKLCHFRLDFERNYDLFAQLTDVTCYDKPPPTIHPQECPEVWRIGVYDDEGIAYRTEDPYGGKLTWVTGMEMKKLVLPEDAGGTNKAIHAFIQAAPDDCLYILWWH